MSEAMDNVVGVPYLHLRHVPQQAVSVFPFLAPCSRAPLFPRVYAASLGFEYMHVADLAPSTPFPDLDFDVQPLFIVVGYRGILCGRVTKVREAMEPSTSGEVMEAQDADDALWDSTMLPFRDDDTLHPTLGSLLSIITVEGDPSWFLFVNGENQEEQCERILAVRVVRVPVVAEAWRLYRALMALVCHHLGASAIEDLCRRMSSLEEFFTVARGYSRDKYNCTMSSPRTAWGHSLSTCFTSEQYKHLADQLISKQLKSVLNTMVPIFADIKSSTEGGAGGGGNNDNTKSNEAWSALLAKGFESARQTGGSDDDDDDNIVSSFPPSLQAAFATLRDDVKQRRAWLAHEQQQYVRLAEAAKRKEEERRTVLQELETVRAQHAATVHEGNKLMAYLALEERRWNTLATAREEERRKEEERLDALRWEYKKRLEESLQELEELRAAKSLAVSEEAMRAAARDKALRALHAERSELVKGVQMLNEHLIEMSGRRTKVAVKCSAKREDACGHCNNHALHEARAQHVALQRVLRKLNCEVEEERKKEEELIGDMQGFNVDVNELEKRKILLKLECSLLADTTAAMQRSLQAQRDALSKERETMMAEREQIPRRLFLQQERTRRSRIAKEEAAALLVRLKSNIAM